ncbi:MAG: alpha-ketoglutarate-dependent dioxygenase AlkB [Hyphomicrobiales bacterium]|nr:alpha-ketoglutarate-dependent dioxygenase AlkB [Hyphomicrobiales bacterium]
MIELASGLIYRPAHFSRAEQEDLVAAIRGVVRAAPLFTPAMPRTGKEFSVRMTNCGPLGWMSDRDGGYRYQELHPETGERWPAIPEALLALWRDVAGIDAPPEACLVNFYAAGARMGLHVDGDEKEPRAPVVSVSLGASCLFRFGGTKRNDPTKSTRLESGDLVVIGGASRLCFHGVDRLYPGTSTLLPNDSRLNLTLRRVNPA